MDTKKPTRKELLLDKHGSEEAVSEYYRQMGAKAKRSSKGGFAHMKEHDPERLSKIASEAGKLGKRTK